MRITWLGQSGLMLEANGYVVLVDPWLSPHADRAVAPPAVRWPPQIDLVLITHGHGDHLDLPGLRALANSTALQEIAAPAPHLDAVAAALPDVRRAGVRPHDTLDRLGGIAVLPAWHGVTTADGYSSMIDASGASPHVGYLLQLAGLNIYVSGDTIAVPELREALSGLRVDLACLPVNGRDATREANGILGNMNGAEAVGFALAIGAHILLPLHHDGVIGNTADLAAVVHPAQGKPLHLLLPARDLAFSLDGTSA